VRNTVRSVDDIRRVLLDHEILAPDGAGLVDAARAGAVRVRRRRRLTVVAAVVVALVVPVAVVASFRETGTAESAVVPASPPYRSTLQLTVGVDPDSGYSVLDYWVNRDRQQLRLRPSTGIEDASVVVHDPATFDSTALRRGQPVTVAGRAARYVPDLDLGVPCTVAAPPGQPAPRGMCQVRFDDAKRVRMPVIGWVEPSGAWVLVFVGERSTQADVARAAAAVRTWPPRDIRAPYRLGYLPAGLAGVYATATDSGPWQPDSLLALDPDPATPVSGLDPATGWIPEITAALTIRAFPRSPYVDEKAAELGRPTRVAGFDVYYATANVGAWRLETGAAVLVVVAGGCQFHVNVRDANRVPYPELVRMVENATFTDCANPTTWITPLT
jgi:hypothetical protein